MSENINLRALTLLDALDLAISKSGKSRVRITDEMGWSTHHANRVFTNERYWWSFEDFPRLLAVLGNSILLDWARVQSEAGGVRHLPEPLDCAALVMRMGVLFRELGDVAREGEEAIKNGRIERGEARRLMRELRELTTAALDTMIGLSGIARDTPE